MNDDSTTIRPGIESLHSPLLTTTTAEVIVADADTGANRGVRSTAYRVSVAFISVGSLIALVTLLSDLWSRRTLRIAQDIGPGPVVTVAAVDLAVPTQDTLEARAESLTIDKQTVAAGEASISKQVVAEQQLVDVPVSHDELFIDRRAVNDSAVTLTTPIGAGADILVPLTEEQLDVRKQVVVSDEIAIGKRSVEGVEHISEPVRHEEIRLDDTGTASTIIPHISDPL